MSEGPSKQDIQAIFKRLRSSPTNKQCFDCGAMNPTWASVTYGVFLCIDCSAVHRGLGVHVTFIRSTQLDTNWTWVQLRAMQVGGNAAATAFFRQHGCTSNDAQQKYHSRASNMYRERLHSSALKAMKTHGTKVHVSSGDQALTSPPATQKEVDFFKEHENMPLTQPETLSQPIPVSNGSLKKATEPADPNEGPCVEAALSTSPTEALKVAEPRKPTIGGRKPTGAKKGLGGKKGLGAQRVKTNFSEVEAAAQQREKNAEMVASSMAAQEAQSQEEEEKRMASMRLAYQDLSVERKKQENKLKASDPKKAEQMERLGMGYGGSRGVSHSALSDMTTIEQSKPKSDYSENRSNRNQLDEDFEFGFSSGPPKYNDSPFGLKKEDSYSSWNSSNNSNKSSSWDMDRFETRSGSTIVEDIPSKEDDDRGRSRKNFEASQSDEAQKKFGGAKAISSDQFFGPRDPDLETKQNLSKFEGQASISSADFFGGSGPSARRQPADYGGTAPDLTEIKEGVRQGVTKVAGRLSSLANGVINSIQDHYG